MALSRGVAPTVSLGLRHHQYDQGLGIPPLQLGDGEVTSAQTAIPMRQASMANPVSYTHLTLPTILLV